MKNLQVSEYLKQNGIEKLQEEFAITVNYHTDLPLCILDYDQIRSKPKDHPIVKECRGLVLETDSWIPVSKGFNRFFNLGEVEWNSNSFTVHTKEDGSYIAVFYYDGKWNINTRKTFGQLPICGDISATWEEVVFSHLELKALSKEFCYIFELVGPKNKIVRDYSEGLILTGLTFLDGYKYKEFPRTLDIAAAIYNRNAGEKKITSTKVHKIKSLKEVEESLQQKEKEDPTFEGYVLVDKETNERVKVKSRTYVDLHHLRGQPGAPWNLKRLLHLILIGESDEVLTYFPEIKDLHNEWKAKLETTYHRVNELYYRKANIQDQKEFALEVKDDPFSSIMFTARKTNKSIEKVWNESTDFIIKKVLE